VVKRGPLDYGEKVSFSGRRGWVRLIACDYGELMMVRMCWVGPGGVPCG
jgi:hypothetical protein